MTDRVSAPAAMTDPASPRLGCFLCLLVALTGWLIVALVVAATAWLSTQMLEVLP